jgi:peptide/nickel transport system permease protein
LSSVPISEVGLAPDIEAVDEGGARALLRELLRSPSALFGSAVLIVVCLVAIFAPLIAPTDPGQIDLFHRLAKPIWLGGSWSRPFGTDALGRNELTLLVYGARVSMSTALIVIALAGTFGTGLGLIAGYFGGWRETIIMRLVDTSIAFPGLLLALIVLVMVGPGQGTLILTLSAISWMIFARVTYGIVISLRQTTFVRAAKTVGCSRTRILIRHLLPNLASALLTVATLEFAAVILAEASLSYLGFGIQPPGTSWGLMVSDGQQYLSDAWWLVATPGMAIALTVLSLNLVAGWLRITADPRQREKQVGELRRERRRAQAVGSDRPKVMVESASGDEGPLLEVEQLRVEFAGSSGAIAHAVRDVSLRVHRGETLAIVGESGSGKSVTGLSLLGLIQPPGTVTEGTIRWRLPRRLGQPSEQRRIAGDVATMIFQDPVASLNPLVPVGRQITEVLKQRGVSNAAARARAIELLELVGIPSPARRLRQHPYELSGGMAQRVMIAIALASEPELIIADEPTTALDVTIQAQVLDLLRDVQRQFGMALILVAHDLGVVAGMCDRVAVMYAGRIVEEGPAAEVFSQPRHPYTAALIGCTPRLDRPKTARMFSIAGSAPPATATARGCAFAPRCPRAVARCDAEIPALASNGQVRFACWNPIAPPLGQAQGA